MLQPWKLGNVLNIQHVIGQNFKLDHLDRISVLKLSLLPAKTFKEYYNTISMKYLFIQKALGYVMFFTKILILVRL